MALTAIAWGLLGFVYRRNSQSQEFFEAPLRETLGDDYAAVAAEERRRRRGGVLRTSWSRRQYVKKADIVRYGPHRANVADIWHRGDLPRDGKAPVLLQVPGGAWAIGMRRPQAYPLMTHMAERGWICVSMAYRVSPRNTWPAHIVDVKRALAWVKENIADYGGDPDFVAITGGSAGGHLTALAALTPNDPQWQPGFEDADTSVVAAVPIYGRYDWFTREGSGRPEFIAILQRYIVKKRFAEHRAGVPRRVADHQGAGRRAAVLRAARHRRLDHPGAGGPRVRRGAGEGVGQPGGLRRDPARPARIRLLRLTARALHRDGGRRTSWTG